MLYHPILPYAIPYYPILYYTILYYAIRYDVEGIFNVYRSCTTVERSFRLHPPLAAEPWMALSRGVPNSKVLVPT